MIRPCGLATRPAPGTPASAPSGAAGRIIVCPTLGRKPSATLPPAMAAIYQRTGLTWQARQALAGKLRAAGVIIAPSGADAGISAGRPYGILANALADLVAGGIPAADALASATSVAARACGLGDRKGRSPRLRRDLVVVEGDPHADIRALSAVQAVYLNGQAVTQLAA